MTNLATNLVATAQRLPDKTGLKLVLLEALGRAVVAPAPERSLLRAVIASERRA